MFSAAPPLDADAAPSGSRSDQLLEPVLEAIRSLGGRLSGDSQAEILETLRLNVPNASGRALNSALWKLVVQQKRLAFAKEEASHRDPMPCARVYRVI